MSIFVALFLILSFPTHYPFCNDILISAMVQPTAAIIYTYGLRYT